MFLRSDRANGGAPLARGKGAPPPPAADPFPWEATLFVWAVWGVALAIALAVVVNYAENVPFVDDWSVVPYMTGEAPVTPGYLWEQHNEHRLPLPKLVLLAVLYLSGGDFRAGAYVNVLLLAGLAFAMIVAVRRLRGRLVYADAFLPLVLLSLGHCENFLWSWQLQYTLSTVLTGGVFLGLLGSRPRVTARTGWVIGACLLLLPLCGGQGLPYTVLLGGWLAWVGWRRRASPHAVERAAGTRLLLLAGTALALVGLFFVDYRKNPGDYATVDDPSPEAVVLTALHILSTSLGPAVLYGGQANFAWPFSWLAVGTIVALSLGGLTAAWFRNPADRERLGGLVLFLLAAVGLVLAMGRSRAGIEVSLTGTGFQPRYTTLMVPLLYGAYFATARPRPARGRGLAAVSLFAVVCSLSALNVSEGVAYAQTRAAAARAFLADLAAGEPAYVLARRHSRPLGFEVEQPLFADYLRRLHRAGIAPYQHLQEDPAFREIPLPVEPVATAELAWRSPVARVHGGDACLTFALKEPRFVSGIQVTVAYTPPGADTAGAAEPAPPDATDAAAFVPPPPWGRKEQLVRGLVPRLGVSWKTVEQGDFVDVDWWSWLEPRWDEERYLEPGPQEQTVTVWVADTIDQFRIFPDKLLRFPLGAQGPPIARDKGPFDCTIAAVRLLVPADD